MKTVKVTCDGCGKDITTRTNMEDYRLVLASESKPGYGAGVYTSMAIEPPLDRAHHFCRMKCLDLWRDRERHRDAICKKHYDEWISERRRDLGLGARSYPCAPPDVRAAWAAEANESALAAFPLTGDPPR